MTEDALLRALLLADRLRIAAVDLAVTGAPLPLVEALWRAVERLPSQVASQTVYEGPGEALRALRISPR